MEWFWKELGIEPTDQVVEIKKAYVTQMREYKKREATESVKPEVYLRLDQAEGLAVAAAEKIGQNSKELASKKEGDFYKNSEPEIEQIDDFVIEEDSILTSEDKLEVFAKLSQTISHVAKEQLAKPSSSGETHKDKKVKTPVLTQTADSANSNEEGALLQLLSKSKHAEDAEEPEPVENKIKKYGKIGIFIWIALSLLRSCVF